jgi:hypothetical protein
LSAAILLVVLPFACGLAAAAFLWMIVRWAAFLVRIGSVVCLLLAVLGFIDLQAASGYASQLWAAVVGLHGLFGRRVIELLAANPVSAASLVIGLCFGLLLTRQRVRRDAAATSVT